MVTGSTSLITVPVMIQFGIEPHVAVATNMLALVFMSIGGSLPFAQKGVLSRERLPSLKAVTIIGSALGAFVLLAIPKGTLELVIAVAMVGVAIFTLLRPEIGVTARLVSRRRETVGYVAAFVLAIYGGFFSGGYVTLLTTAFVLLFGMTFLHSRSHYEDRQRFFFCRGSADLRVAGCCGLQARCNSGNHHVPWCHDRWARDYADQPVWLRRVFIAVVIGLALKMLFNFVKP